MIKDLWDIAQGLLGLKESFKKAKRDRKDRIANYFLTIGKIIQEAADIFKKGEVPHGACQKMLEHSEYFTAVVEDVIDEEVAQEFQEKLVKSHEIESLDSEIFGHDGSDENIAELEKISASFIILSDVIKASK